MRIPFFLLPFLLLTASCKKTPPDMTLPEVNKKLATLISRVPMGDTAHIEMTPFEQSDWFVIVPPMANAVSFETSTPAFAKAQAAALPALSGKNDYYMALVKDGEVGATQILDSPFFVQNVLAKPGKVTNSLRVVRLIGMGYTYRIVNID